jgi:RNA polymerase sigma-70 factor (ECF subfamily)
MGIGDFEASRPSLPSIHEAHADFVWRSLQRLGVPESDLEDALQEVFVVVHRRLASFRGDSTVTTWLFGIALRVAARFRRRGYLRREEPIDDVAKHPAAGEGTEPEAMALAREAREELGRVLDELDPEKRVVFVMFELERRECPLIAEELGIPVGTVYSRLHAARAKFRAAALRLRKREER